MSVGPIRPKCSGCWTHWQTDELCPCNWQRAERGHQDGSITKAVIPGAAHHEMGAPQTQGEQLKRIPMTSKP